MSKRGSEQWSPRSLSRSPLTRSSSSSPLSDRRSSRRLTADNMALQALLDEHSTDSTSLDLSELGRSEKGPRSASRSPPSTPLSDRRSSRRLTADNMALQALLDEHSAESPMLDLSDLGRSERGRRDTVDSSALALLASELELDETHTRASLSSVDTFALMHSVEALIGGDSRRSSCSSVDSTGSSRRSRRLMTKSPTAVVLSSVVVDVDFNQQQQSVLRATHQPTSALKSCLSGKKSASARKVVFGSPSAMEFNKDSVPHRFTPMTREHASRLFVVQESPAVPEDEVTAENSRILEEWDRLSNASGYNSAEDTSPSPKRARRRVSRVHSRISSVNVGVLDDADSSMEHTATVHLPSTLLESMLENARIIGVQSEGCEGADESLVSEHTHELEVDLHSLVRNAALCGSPAARGRESDVGSSPGLADCNKSWVNISSASPFAEVGSKGRGSMDAADASTLFESMRRPGTSREESLGPLLGLDIHSSNVSSTDESVASFNPLTFEPVSEKHEAVPHRELSPAVENAPSATAFEERVVASCAPAQAAMDVSAVEAPIHQDAVEAPIVSTKMLDRLKRLNDGARINSIAQNGTPSANRSRAGASIRRRTAAPQISEVKPTLRVEKRAREAGAVEIARSSVRPAVEAAAAESADELLEEPAPVTAVVSEASAELAKENVSHVNVSNVSAVVAAEQGKVQALDAELCPVLQEIQTLHSKLQDLQRQRKAKALRTVEKTARPLVEAETEAALPLVALSDTAEVARAAEAVVPEALLAEKEPVRTSPSSVVASGLISTARAALDDVAILIDIVNRLTYCHVKKYKTDEIVVDVALVSGVTVVLHFSIVNDLAAYTNVKNIASIVIEVEEKESAHSLADDAIAKLYFYKFVCMSSIQTTLDGVKTTRDIVALIRKFSGYIRSLRVSLTQLKAARLAGWTYSLLDEAVSLVKGGCALSIPLASLIRGSFFGITLNSGSIAQHLRATDANPFEAFPLQSVLNCVECI